MRSTERLRGNAAIFSFAELAPLAERRPDQARRHLLAIARDKGFRPRRRAAALIAAATPGLASSWLHARRSGSIELGTGANLTTQSPNPHRRREIR